MASSRPILRILPVLMAGCLWLPTGPAAVSQDPYVFNPARFGFRLPPGEVKWPKRTVNVEVTDGSEKTVARVVAKVGENFVVMMPDGSLAARVGTQATLTDKPVEWLTPKQLAEKVKTGMLANFQVTTRKNHVFLFNTSEKMAEVTIRVMESMARGLVKHMTALGLKAHDPEVPLVVIMFRTEAQFQAFKRMPRGVVAYYNILSNRVYLHEESPLLNVDRELAIRQTLSTIAHEGAHQILANIGIQQRLSGWPMWLSEGMAEYLAPTSVTRNIQWKGAGQVNDFRMLELETHLRHKSISGIDGKVLENTVGAARLTSTGYASAWSLTTFLAKRKRTDFKKYLKTVSQLRPFEGHFQEQPTQSLLPKNNREFEKVFGKDWKKLEEEMIRFLTKQKFESPFSEFPHVAVLVEIPGKRKPEKRTAVFHNEILAQRWAKEINDKAEGTARPRIVLVRCRNREAAIKRTNEFFTARN